MELTDSTGNVVQAYVYDSFGTIVSQNNSIENPFTYTAREIDNETGMYYYRARYYDPGIGRFLQEDPIGLGGAQVCFDKFNRKDFINCISSPSNLNHLYSYVENNSINIVDPLGLKSFKERAECAAKDCFIEFQIAGNVCNTSMGYVLVCAVCCQKTARLIPKPQMAGL